MRFGLQIGHVDMVRLHDVAQAAEEQGFDAVYFPDHLVAEGPERQRMGVPSWDCMMQAAVVARATRRVRIGHLVLCNLFRHPALTAQSLATLDHLSGGRAVVGLGSGWTETEFRMTGIPFPPIAPRLRMLDEALECIKGLWAGAPFTHEGEFYRFHEADLLPRPVQQPHPPILLGGGGRGLLRVAARYADVLNIISDVGRAGYISMAGATRLDDDAFRAKVDFVRTEAARLGRDPRAIEISNVCFTLALFDSTGESKAMREDTAAAVGVPPEAVARAPMMLVGTPDEIVRELERRAREWGVREIVVPLQDEAVAARFAREVIPALKAR